jgi:hypothetical protein
MSVEATDAAPTRENIDGGPELRKFVEVLDYLAKMTDDEEAQHEDRYDVGYDRRRVNRMDVERVMAIVSPDGVQFFDVNEKVQPGHVTAAQIRRSLRARKGMAFDVFAHLAYLRSHVFRWGDRSVALEGREGDELYVRIAGKYRLVFRKVGGGVVLVRCDYYQREGH